MIAPTVDADWRSRRHRRTRSLCASSFEHLIRPRQERRRYRQAEGFRGLQVDEQLELGGLLHGKVGGLGALEDLVNIGRSAPEALAEIDPVCHETTGLRIVLH